MKLGAAISALSFSVGMGHALADGATQDDTVVVMASRVSLSSRETSETFTVVEREKIEMINPSSAADLLSHVPGLSVERAGPGAFVSLYVHGSDPNHVLVLIDGVRANDSTNSRGGAYDVSGLNVADIEKIEVLRGSQSAIYGADAIGGVINIITRQTVVERGDVHASLGGFGYESFGARWGHANYSLGVSEQQDGTDAIGGTIDLRQLRFHTTGGIAASFSFDADARVSERKSSAFPDDSGGLEFAQIRALEVRDSTEFGAGFRARWPGEQGATQLALSSFGIREDTRSPGIAPGQRNPMGIPAYESHTDYHRDSVLVHTARPFGEGSEVAFGGEAESEQGTNRTSYHLFGVLVPADFELPRRTIAAFTEVKWVPRPDTFLHSGLRWDNVTTLGSHQSYSIGVRHWLSRLNGSVTADVATGFKPPSFFSLGLPVALGGNPSLLPETSRSASVGYQRTFGSKKSLVSISGFTVDYKNLITYDSNANRLLNADSISIQGVELELRLPIGPSLQAIGHLTKLRSSLLEGDQPLRQRPGRRVGLDIQYAISSKAQILGRILYVSDIFDSSIPTGGLMLPANKRVDLSYSSRVSERVTVRLAIDDLFNERAEMTIGSPLAGRRMRLGLDASF